VAAAADVHGGAPGLAHLVVAEEADHLHRVAAVGAGHLRAGGVEPGLGVAADHAIGAAVVHEAPVGGEGPHPHVALREQHAVAVEIERLAAGPQLVGVAGGDAGAAEVDGRVTANGEDEGAAHAPALVRGVRAGAGVRIHAVRVAGVGIGGRAAVGD